MKIVTLESLQAAGRHAKYKRFVSGKPLPGRKRLRARTPAKRDLLKRAVLDAYRRTPPRFEKIEGRRVLVLPWLSE